jgi:type I restriction-modification system DNA methylase subunit
LELAKKEKEITIDSFISKLQGLSGSRSVREVFADCVDCFAISIHNSMFNDDDLENEYLRIINSYNKKEIDTIVSLFAYLVILLENSGQPEDILGKVYESLSLNNKKSGQYFTPSEICDLMAEIAPYDDSILFNKYGFVTVSDSSCGSGNTLIAFAKRLINLGHNPAYTMYAEGIELNRTTALMSYIQLSLWNVPATIFVGNTISMDLQQRWHTPAYYMYGWLYKLLKLKDNTVDTLSLNNNVETTKEIDTVPIGLFY